jgi:hypothetical protein
MKRRLALGVLSAALATSLLGVSTASAATEFGDNCAANGGAPDYTFVALTAPGNPLPLTAPVGGVITRWQSNVALSSPPPEPLSEALTVLRPAGGAVQFTVVGQSSPSPVSNGQNSFPTRIPVQVGDRLGLAGAFAPLYCQTSSASDAMGVFNAVLSPGTTQTFINTPGYRVPASAVIEADADGDGFGDETQDACPQSAAVQVACPVVSLNISTTKKKKLVDVIVTSTSTAKVTVNGKVSLGKGKKAKLKGGSKSAGPGLFTRFHLNFTANLIDRLKELTPKQSLTLKITASAPNVAGAPTKKVIKVKLKGQG